MNKIFEPQLFFRQRLACTLFARSLDEGKLAHAYLLTGRATQDKAAIVKYLAAHLNCLALDAKQTGSCMFKAANPDRPEPSTDHFCQNCKWLATSGHPQALMELAADEGKKSGKIPVEKARLLSAELTKTSNYFRVIVVPDAAEDAFHRATANALLKTIEEPQAAVAFFFFADSPEAVLSTIVSRCQQVPVVLTGQEALANDTGEQSPEHQALVSDTAKQISEIFAHSTSQDKNRAPRATVSTHAKACQVLSALNWSDHIQTWIDQDLPAVEIIDMVAKREVDDLRERAQQEKMVSLYLKQVLDLAEATKDQIGHYVQAKSSIESFTLRLSELRRKYYLT